MAISQPTTPRCSFCRRAESPNLPLIVSMDGRICRYCAAECLEIIDTRNMGGAIGVVDCRDCQWCSTRGDGEQGEQA